MANEASIVTMATFAKGNVSSIARGSTTAFTITVSGAKYHQGVQNIGTSEEQISFGDITNPGMCWLKNLDATNYVEIRSGTGAADLMKLAAGQVAVFMFAADCTAPYALANTSSVNLEILLVEA